eukprot:CAMPEP_0194339904 /NCGR_PEP_ID=MMETSP0171-20130528/84749_1 /TAXON_ID=218684 /ORGANISM="Corethron pennatum, Strain L29A3" /LENGTH=117 /DNA_ID=CAMNT_0039104663 /DNA_START=209 /DNA_END=559 /DNA_ORIENTATION=-
MRGKQHTSQWGKGGIAVSPISNGDILVDLVLRRGGTSRDMEEEVRDADGGRGRRPHRSAASGHGRPAVPTRRDRDGGPSVPRPDVHDGCHGAGAPPHADTRARFMCNSRRLPRRIPG